MVSSEQRRKQLAREKYLRQQQRRSEARRKARWRNSAIAAGVALVLAASAAYAASGGLGGEKKEDTAADSNPTPSPTPEKEAPDPCDKPAKGEPNGKQWKKEPELTVDESAKYTMTLQTTCGEIGVEMDASKAPHTVNSFDFLAGKDYFDHTKCHRLTTEGIHVLQCGDPQGTGMGSPGYTIPDENLKDPKIQDSVYPAGTVAMAKSQQPDSGGSQFFFVYKDSKLPPNYTPFGKVTAGMDVLKKIAKAGVQGPGADGAPVATVVIDEATVDKAA